MSRFPAHSFIPLQCTRYCVTCRNIRGNQAHPYSSGSSGKTETGHFKTCDGASSGQDTQESRKPPGAATSHLRTESLGGTSWHRSERQRMNGRTNRKNRVHRGLGVGWASRHTHTGGMDAFISQGQLRNRFWGMSGK